MTEDYRLMAREMIDDAGPEYAGIRGRIDASLARARETVSIVRGWPRPLAHSLLDDLRAVDPVLDELLILEGDPTAPDVPGILPAGRVAR